MDYIFTRYIYNGASHVVSEEPIIDSVLLIVHCYIFWDFHDLRTQKL